MNNFNEIIKNTCMDGIGKRGSILPLLIKNLPKEIKDQLNNILNKNKNWQSITNIIKAICLNQTLNNCQTCNKQLRYSQHRFCCPSCAQKSKLVREKFKQTNLKKFGVEFPIQLKEIKQKRQQTNLQKFGVKNPIQLREIQQKYKQTCLQRFGVEHPAQCQEIKQKMKQTCLQKYGVQFTGSMQQVINGRAKTMLEKFGVIYPNQSQKFKQIISRKNLDNFYENIILNKFSKFNIIPLFTKDQYKGHACKSNFKYKWKCTICGNQFEQKIQTTNFNQQCTQLPRCLNCFPFLRHTSRLEKQLVKFCKQYFPNLEENKRDLISPQQVDIYIKQLNLAIEFNGIYFHSLIFKDQYYHLNKLKKCVQKNTKLIFIWENDWCQKKQEIKEYLNNIFNNPEKITIGNNSKIEKVFFNNKIFFIQKIF